MSLILRSSGGQAFLIVVIGVGDDEFFFGTDYTDYTDFLLGGQGLFIVVIRI